MPVFSFISEIAETHLKLAAIPSHDDAPHRNSLVAEALRLSAFAEGIMGRQIGKRRLQSAARLIGANSELYSAHDWRSMACREDHLAAVRCAILAEERNMASSLLKTGRTMQGVGEQKDLLTALLNDESPKNADSRLSKDFLDYLEFLRHPFAHRCYPTCLWATVLEWGALTAMHFLPSAPQIDWKWVLRTIRR